MSAYTPVDPTLWKLRVAFAERTGTDPQDWHLVFKARYGMRECFDALRDVRGAGNVVTTLFTGCTAVDSILSAQMTPRYADIDFDLLTIDVRSLELAPSDRAVLLQNSYGMIDPSVTASCAAKAHAAGALFVEDSAHCLARMARDDSGALIADIAIHSLGIEKQFSIGFGGAIWVNPDMSDTELRDAISERLEALAPLPGDIAERACKYRSQNRILAHLPRIISIPLRKRLLARGRFEPAVADIERLGDLPYRSYLPSPWIAGRILEAIGGIDADESNRRALTSVYARELADLEGIRIPSAALGIASAQSLIRFPLVMEDERAATALIAELRGAGYYCVDWYRVPFYPGALELEKYGVSHDDGAYLSFLSTFGGIVGLPTDIDPSAQQNVIDIVRRHAGA